MNKYSENIRFDEEDIQRRTLPKNPMENDEWVDVWQKVYRTT